MSTSASEGSLFHLKCRGGNYPSSSIVRFPVADDKISWSVPYPEYNPPLYNSVNAMGKPWSDPNINEMPTNWYKINDKINRISYHGEYKFNSEGYPLNPVGRTGIKGKGILGRWGVNHAADTIITRFKNDSKILQFIAIQRKDTLEWAIPGGMVDPCETALTAMMREFFEEAVDGGDQDEVKNVLLKNLNHVIIYKGYVDDPRNTDNSWIETTAFHLHDSNNLLNKLNLKAGSDARNVQWVDINKNIQLYASHADFIKTVAQSINADY